MTELKACIQSEDYQKYVLSENGKTYEALNPKRNHSIAYKIDGCYFKNSTSCDFLLVNYDSKKAYFIECKGRDVAKACIQLNDTINKLKEHINTFNVNARVVASKVTTHNIDTTNEKILKHTLKKINGNSYSDKENYKKSSIKLIENIS